ncbi:sporulation protein YqfD [Clostridium sp. LIBA-8841]|uniref:sporulation protein YqfD n=1 Tax=Clostridium sp. LIBA-8841 TaxID=2987530 RepID=UPI002AC48AEC|nr:sporulation protein YqfD [Clostridium sp. LIBA-8841]MDZ5252965.1 sporulation protein YqfD [Clostridium sp. LIBA-8841]
MRLDFLKKGQIKVEIKTFDINKLLNVLWKNGINVENVRKIDVVTVTLNIDYSDYGNLKGYVKRLDGKVKIISAKGMIFFLARAKKSISVFVGALIFLIGLYIYSGFIWRIDIETKKNIAPFEIRTMLNEFNIKPGVKKSSVNVYGLEKKLENGHGDIMWVNARIEGGTLKIKVEEKVSPKIREENENKELKNIVASMDGEIKKIYTTSGTAVVKEGDIVKKGDVLIIPQQGIEGGEYEVDAKGEVTANTFYEKSIELQVAGKKEERTGEKDSDIYLEIMGKKIYLKKPTKEFAKYDKIESKGKFVNRNIYYEKIDNDIAEDKETIINNAVELMSKSINKEISKQAKIVDKIITTEDLGEGKIKLKVLFVVEQNIALNY